MVLIHNNILIILSLSSDKRKKFPKTFIDASFLLKNLQITFMTYFLQIITINNESKIHLRPSSFPSIGILFIRREFLEERSDARGYRFTMLECVPGVWLYFHFSKEPAFLFFFISTSWRPHFRLIARL